MTSPKILHIETTGKNCSVCISNGEEILCLCEEFSENYSHSKNLHRFVKWALEGAEIDIKDLDAISVSQGPGSYTGLRIGVSAAKGFAFGLQKPLIKTDTLHTMAVPFLNDEYDFVVSVLDAKREEVFYQIFAKNKTITQASNANVNRNFFDNFLNKKVLFLGSGASKIETFVKENLPKEGYQFSYKPDVLISSENAVPEALEKFQQKEFEDIIYFEPAYIKEVYTTPPKTQ